MKISIILAIDNNGLMGVNQEIPWHLPNDFKYFKEKTVGKPIIMGKKTYDSMGRALPKRTNIVLSRNPLTHYKDAITVTHIDDAIKIASLENTEECFIIGGSEIYNLVLKNNLVDNIYITRVDTKIITDNDNDNIYFDESLLKGWDLKSVTTSNKNEKNKYDQHYLFYRK